MARRFSAEDALDRILADSDSESELEDSGDEFVPGGDTDSAVNSDGDAVMQDAAPQGAVRGHLPQARAARRDTDIDWEAITNNEVFSLDWCPDFDESKEYPCLKEDMTGKTPVQFFYEFFPPSLFTTFAEQTNLYAMQFLDSTVDFPEKSRYHQWYDTTAAEMRAYVALEIAMGLVQKPVIRQYWEEWWLGSTPKFTDVMRQDRFILLRNFFHINDNNVRTENRDDPGYDKMFKIRPLLDKVLPTYMKLYDCSRHLSIDESMQRFKGRLSFRQYMPAKPTKWGIKLWSLADSDTGFLLRWIPYTGKETNAEDVGLTTRVVLDLLQDDFDNKGHHLYTDNFYSSPELFLSLKEKNIGACGTVRSNRCGLPDGVKASVTKLKKGDPPKYWKSDASSLLACTWQDTGRVTMLSTIHDSSVERTQIRSKDTETGFRELQKPNLAVKYNSKMGGVDLFDQMSGYYSFPHKAMKWYHVLYHFSKEVALVNGYIAYTLFTKDKKMSQIKFRREVIEGLLEDYEMPGPVRRGRPVRNPKLQNRLTDRHFPSFHGEMCDCEICVRARARNENTPFKPDCTVCSLRPRNCEATRKDRSKCKRKQTKFFCKDCPELPSLCPTDCFRIYHTVERYKKKCTCD